MHYHTLESEAAGERMTRKWAAVKSIMDMAWEKSGEFRARMEKAGLKPDDIRDFGAFASIPVLRKKDLIAWQADKGLEWFLTEGVGGLSRIYQSPGPIFDPEGRGEDYWGWTEAFHAAGFRRGDVAQMTFSYHLTPAGLMLEEPLRNLGCAVIPAGPGNSQVQLELMTRLPVTGFVGMASYLKALGEKALASGLNLRKDITLRTAFVAAEKLTESLRADVEQLFGMTVRQGYGTADVGCIAYECEELGGMHVSSRCWVEICDPATGTPLPFGETGEVVVTPFVGDYPLIRLATGDLSRYVEGECACGRTSVRLAGFLGRADDTAKVKGQFIYPSQAAKVMESFPQIRAWRIVVTGSGGRDRLTLRLEVEGALDEGGFVSAFQNAMKLRPALEVLSPGELGDGPLLVDERSFK